MAKEGCCKWVLFILIVFGAGLLISGIIVAVLGSFTSLADDEIKKALPLKEGSTSFENWEKPDGDFFIEYYVFNITDTGNATVLPSVKELGPYTYRRKAKTNLKKRQGQTLTYYPQTEYHYEKSKSCTGCDPAKDKITAVNYPLLVLLRGVQFSLINKNATEVKTTAAKVAGLLNFLKIGLFQERTVEEFLWGYQDLIFAFTAKSISNTTFPSEYALQVNNSGSGLTKIHTGEHDVDRVAEYLEWNNFTTLPWWKSASANMINGTGGTRFRPFIEKDDDLYVLVTEICRSLKVTYDSTVTVHGIDLYRFTPPKDVFITGDKNPENKGFCVTSPGNKCLPTGLLDVNPCKGGAKAPPFVASTPHFYHGDPLLSQIFKLTPTKEKHATFIDIEPNTGLTMSGHKRLQLNFVMPRSLNIQSMLSGNTDVFFVPSFFTDETAMISEDDADDFKKSVLLPLRVAKAMPYVMIGLGALLLVIVVVIIFVRRSNRRKTKSGSHMNKENYAM